MTIQEFAEVRSIRLRRDSCNDVIIPGKRFLTALSAKRTGRPEYQCHIFDPERGDRTLGLCLLFATPNKWTRARHALEAAGFTLGQDGETEGTLLFDSDNSAQSSLALKGCSIRVRREVSEVRRQELVAQLAAARQTRKAA